MSRLLSIAGCLLALTAALMVPVIVFGWILAMGGHSGHREAGAVVAFEFFVAAMVGLGGLRLFRKHRAAWDGEITHPHASGRQHTLVHALRTETGVFHIRLVWSVVDPAHDASRALVTALAEVLPPTITNQELAQARAALTTRFAKEGVTVLVLELA